MPFEDTYYSYVVPPLDILFLSSFPPCPTSPPTPLYFRLLLRCSCLSSTPTATIPISPFSDLLLPFHVTTLRDKQHRPLRGRTGSVRRGRAQIGARARRLQLAIRLLRTRPGPHAHAPHRSRGKPPPALGGARAQRYPLVNSHDDDRAIRAARSRAHEGTCGAGPAPRSAGSSGAIQPQEAQHERPYGRGRRGGCSGGGGGGHACHICCEGVSVLLCRRRGGGAVRTPIWVQNLSARALFERWWPRAYWGRGGGCGSFGAAI